MENQAAPPLRFSLLATMCGREEPSHVRGSHRVLLDMMTSGVLVCSRGCSAGRPASVDKGLRDGPDVLMTGFFADLHLGLGL